METIIFQEIDGYEIIVGFGAPVPNPVATGAKVKDLLAKTNEYKAMIALADERREIMRAYREETRRINEETNAKVASGELKTPAQASEYAYAQIQPAVSARDTALAANQDAASVAADAMEEKRKELARANPVYFEVCAHERIVTEDEANALRVAMSEAPEVGKVTTTGDVVEDHRNGEYWSKTGNKWHRETVDKLGKKTKGKPLENLSEEERAEIMAQLDGERIAGLKPKEKEAEKVKAVETAANQAAHMRSKLEIQGDKKALDKAQQWYGAEVERLEALYS